MKQLGDITDNVNIAMADTSVLSDFEPPTASNRTEHGAATTRELWTPVKLIVLSTADMATSPFAQYNSSTDKQTNKQTDKQTDRQGTE